MGRCGYTSEDGRNLACLPATVSHRITRSFVPRDLPTPHASRWALPRSARGWCSFRGACSAWFRLPRRVSRLSWSYSPPLYITIACSGLALRLSPPQAHLSPSPLTETLARSLAIPSLRHASPVISPPPPLPLSTMDPHLYPPCPTALRPVVVAVVSRPPACRKKRSAVQRSASRRHRGRGAGVCTYRVCKLCLSRPDPSRA